MRFFYSLLLLGMLAACAPPPAPVWTELPAADSLLRLLKEHSGQTRSLDAAATVRISVKERFFSSQQFLLVEAPEKLRTDVLTGFGQLVLQLASDGDELAVFMNTTVPARFYRGPASADSLARFTRIPLQPREMVRFILYDPPLIQFDRTAVIADSSGLELRLDGPVFKQTLLFDGQLRLIGSRYQNNGRMFLEVLYQNLDPVDGYPHAIRLKMPEQGVKAGFKFSELSTNVAIPAERFRLQPPVDIPVEPLPQ